MSLKEFSVRCSAITLVTANALGIVLATGPRLPRTMPRKRTASLSDLSNRKPRFSITPIHAPQGA